MPILNFGINYFNQLYLELEHLRIHRHISKFSSFHILIGFCADSIEVYAAVYLPTKNGIKLHRPVALSLSLSLSCRPNPELHLLPGAL